MRGINGDKIGRYQLLNAVRIVGKTARSVKDEARKDGFVASTGDRMLRAATE